MDWKAQLGRNILSLRTGKGWSQQSLAGEAELSLRYLAGVERGEENPSIETIISIADALGVDVGELFARRDADRAQHHN
ncbi:helix-turn-helix transcriptional regulator [Brevundimonas sp.]|uniref:helix-turn-helix domain-containing protein n=1 Tax=Brevundimonas sp. TaxID=1871086 RepID=UPI00286C1D1E|nr:helix-turn-helix transcriptional regulator [Brevundimonas sp.]